MSEDERSEKIEGLLNAGLPEIRSMAFSDFEVQNDGWGFRGLANAYDHEADLGDFTEEFRRGAFRKPLANGDNTRLIYEHAPPHLPVLATRSGGTLQLKDDVKGLDVRGEIAQHYIGEAARELIKRGDIRGMSPGFIVGQGNSEISYRSGKPHRAITNLQYLSEVSLTTDPAYPGTTAEMRSMWAAYTELEDRASKTYTAAQREAATTMPDGSFPIDTVADLKRAIQSIGRAKDRAAAMAWIKKRAKALGATDLLPEEWRSAHDDTILETEEQTPAGEAPAARGGASDSPSQNASRTPTEEHRSEPAPDDASGVAVRAAARRRRLQMMGISIPAEFRQ